MPMYEAERDLLPRREVTCEYPARATYWIQAKPTSKPLLLLSLLRKRRTRRQCWLLRASPHEEPWLSSGRKSFPQTKRLFNRTEKERKCELTVAFMVWCGCWSWQPERYTSLTVFTEVVSLDKEHEHRIEFLVSVHDPDQVARVSLCINLTVVVPPKKSQWQQR